MNNYMLGIYFILIFSSFSFGKVYYIDYIKGNDDNQGIQKEKPWKLHPGQPGFKGLYSHHPGDSFVFKGGVIWPASTLPLKINFSGTKGRLDTYTADTNWFQGNSFMQPMFDGEHREIQLLFAEKESCFTVSNLAFRDFGISGVKNGGKGVEINGCSRYTISHCTITPQSWIGIYLHSYFGKTCEDISIEDCDISAAGQAIVIATEAANTIFSNVNLRNNRIHDLSPQITGDTHGDGIHTWNSPETDNSQYIQDLTICNNMFYGDFSRTGEGSASMTSLIYLTDPGKRAYIYNNVLSYTKATSFSGLVWIRYFDSVYVYHNTFIQKPEIGGLGILVGQGASSGIEIKNNIFYGCQSAYYIYKDASPSIKIDYNCCFVNSPGIGYWKEKGMDIASWKAIGNDRHGVFSNPGFISGSDFHLSSNSLCINSGDTSLGMRYGTDIDGNNRLGKPDIGAYEFKLLDPKN